MANNENEITLIDRYTGEEQSVNLDDFVHLIQTVFPDREEQKELLQMMFDNAID